MRFQMQTNQQSKIKRLPIYSFPLPSSQINKILNQPITTNLLTLSYPMPLSYQSHTDFSLQRSTVYQSSLLSRSKLKKKSNSSDEQTNQEEMESRREVALKLFQGIKQLEEPEPDGNVMRVEQSIGEDRLEQMKGSTVKRYHTQNHSKNTYSESQVKELMSHTINSCTQIMNQNINVLSTHIAYLNKKIIKLHEKILHLPLTLQQIKTNHNRKIFMTNYFYQKDINELNSRIVQLQKHIQLTKTLGQPNISGRKGQLCSLRVVPEYKLNQQLFDQLCVKSLPQCRLSSLQEQFDQQEEKSLLEGIDQELSQSGLKQYSKKQPNLSQNYAQESKYQNFLTLPQLHQQTVKKKLNQSKLQTPLKQPLSTTIKKDQPPDDNGMILMSFAKNQQIIIVEEEMLSQRSGDGQADNFNCQYIQTKSKNKNKKLSYPYTKPKTHTQKSLQFSTPPLVRQSTLEYSPYQQSQVQQFAIRQSPVITKRLSIYKRKVPSLVEDSCLPQDLVLSKEEKYLLDEIKLLRDIVGEGEEEKEEVQWSDSGLRDSVRKSGGKKENKKKRELKLEKELRISQEHLEDSENKQKILLNLLMKTKNQLCSMKQNLTLLLPCQYCSFKQHLQKNLLQKNSSS